MALEFLKNENKRLKKLAASTKTFMNMVIHDLRNPTQQIKFTIDHSVDLIRASSKQFSVLNQEMTKMHKMK